MEVIINGIVYVPKENKSKLEIMKEKYDSKEYICIYKDSQWNKCIPILDEETNINDYKLVNKKHEHILDMYLKDNSVAVEYEYPIKNMLQWHNINCDWLSIYDETINYRLKQKEWYENTDNFPCIVMQVNCVDGYAIDCGYLVFRNIDDFNRFGGDYRFLTKEEVLSLLIKE